MRGATSHRLLHFCPCHPFLLTRPMRGATLALLRSLGFFRISTHTPHARRNFWLKNRKPDVWHFYSHASCEARRRQPFLDDVSQEFLLTRLLRGATGLETQEIAKNFNFYSHASCEARLTSTRISRDSIDFYSHASCEARQSLDVWHFGDNYISTHTPLARRDTT